MYRSIWEERLFGISHRKTTTLVPEEPEGKIVGFEEYNLKGVM
jgi:hypothetical protein